MALLQALVIGLLALIITPGYLFYFDVTPKVVVLLGGSAVALLGCGAALTADLRGRGRTWRLFSLLLALQVLSLAISTALSTKPALSAFGTNWRRFGSVIQAALLLFAWLVATHAAGRLDRVRAILRGIAAAGGLSALYGIAQYFGWDPILPAAGYHIGEGIWMIVRPPGTLGYVSYFATWLLFVTFLSLSLAALETSSLSPSSFNSSSSSSGTDDRLLSSVQPLSSLRSAIWRNMAFGTAAISTVAMLLTGTRAAMLGLVAGIAVWQYSRRKAKAPVARKAKPPVAQRSNPGNPPLRAPYRSRRMLAAALLLACGVGFYFSPPGWRLRSRTRWFAEDPWGGNRLALWRDTLRMALPRLPLGYGPEVFTAAFPRFESKALAQSYPDFLHESPHNIFLDALISQGLPGLLILCGLCYVGLQRVKGASDGAQRDQQPSSPDQRAGTPSKPAPDQNLGSPSAWIQAALAAGIVSQQFTVFTVPTALIFYVTISLAVACASEAAEPRRDWRFTFAAAPVAIALLYLAARFVISDHALALARRSVEAGDLPSAIVRYEQYRRWNLPGNTSDLWYSRALLGLAQKTPNFNLRFQAIANSGMAAVRATAAAEDPFNAWYNMALLYASQNDSARTESCLRAALAANPNWFKPHWTLAQLLRLEHRMDEAEREAVLAAELDAGKNPEVAQTLRDIRAQRALPAPSQHP